MSLARRFNAGEGFVSDQRPEPWLRSTLNRNAVAPSSPGLAAAATLGSRMKLSFNRKAVASFPRRPKTGRNRLAVGDQWIPFL